jgi:hypothetical protein
MNRSINNHRLNVTECQIMLRRKLRLSVFPHDFPCTCGKTHDAKGDHAFCCSRSHKGSARNQIAHQIARAIGPVLAVANITRTDTSIETEPRLYLTSDPLSRPYDISFNPNNPNHHSHEYNTIGFDITIANATKPLNCQCRRLSSGLREEKTHQNQQHQQNQQHESRFTCTRQSRDWRLTPSNRLLIPIAMDANGRLGPMFQYTLYRTIPQPIPPRKQFNSSRPNAKAMYERATSIPAPCGILLEADNNWK